jgi:hypothetical protein
LIIPYSLDDYIEYYSFYGANISSVYIHTGISNVFENAFGNVTGLTRVYYNGTEEEWLGFTVGLPDGNDALKNAIDNGVRMYYEYSYE